MDPKIFGLAESATAAEVETAAKALVSGCNRLVALAGADSLDAALGTLAAAMESHKAHPAALDKIAAMESDGNRRQLRATLEKGMSGKAPTLSIGRIRAAVVSQLGALDEDKGKAITAALDALDETQAADASAVLDAVCSVDPGPAGLRIVAAYVANATPMHGQPVEEPVADAAALAEADANLSASAQQVKTAAAAARKTLDRGKAAARK
jgi:hypothetical protein